MFFYMPAKLYEESHCVRSHVRELCALGSRALIVTGRHSAQENGSLQDVQEALNKGNVSYVLFQEVEENPSVETVMKARDLGVRESVDLVIGIGGGSPMDAAKAIALMIYHRDRDWTYMYEQGADSSRIPLVLIPTTCGTGSEATGISVLTRHDLKTKGSIRHRIYADLALMDGEYLLSAPFEVIRSTAMDALSHLYESYINTKATDYSRMCVDKGLEVWSRSKNILFGIKPAKKKDLRNMMTASTIAGMAINLTGTTIPHAMSYRLTYSLHMPHGKAVGFFQRGYLREADPEDRQHVLNLSGFTSLDDLEDFYETACGRDEVPEELVGQMINDVLSNPERMGACPYQLDENVLRRVAGVSR